MTKTCAIKHVSGVDGIYDGIFPVRSETLLPTILVSGDDKYTVCSLNGSIVGLEVKPDYDNTIPLAWSLDSVALNFRIAAGYAEDGNYGLTLRMRARSDDSTLRTFGPTQDFLTFSEKFTFADTWFVKDGLFQTCTGTFTLFEGAAMTAANAPLFKGYLAPSNFVPVGQLAFDYSNVVFTFSSDITNIGLAALTVYDVTPYSAKIRATAADVANMFNASYPLTGWFELTPVDPTNLGTSFPISSTPVQTFTSLNTAGRNLAFYDTLPSPLDVQNPKTALQPNTTYWARAKVGLNGETLASAWTSFTTPLYDTVVL